MEAIKQLKDLYDEGLMTKEEYDERRLQVINAMTDTDYGLGGNSAPAGSGALAPCCCFFFLPHSVRGRWPAAGRRRGRGSVGHRYASAAGGWAGADAHRRCVLGKNSGCAGRCRRASGREEGHQARTADRHAQDWREAVRTGEGACVGRELRFFHLTTPCARATGHLPCRGGQRDRGAQGLARKRG